MQQSFTIKITVKNFLKLNKSIAKQKVNEFEALQKFL